MNVSPINSTSPSLAPVQPIKEEVAPIVFPKEIAIRIRTVNLMAHKIVPNIAPSFCQVINTLDNPKSAVAFTECEELFEDAFINEFSSEEIDLFLAYFFKHFDPSQSFIKYENIESMEAKNFLWECIIRYFCFHYVGFKTRVLDLSEAFETFKKRYDHSGDVILMDPTEYSTQLEENFDCSMYIIPQFSSDDIIQMKLLSISYAALLLTSLRELVELDTTKVYLSEEFTIHDLFEEIIAMLLQLPFMHQNAVSPNLSHQDQLDDLQPDDLKRLFLSELVKFLVDSGDPLYEQNTAAIEEVMNDSSFLDFEIKEILENIRDWKLKKK